MGCFFSDKAKQRVVHFGLFESFHNLFERTNFCRFRQSLQNLRKCIQVKINPVEEDSFFNLSFSFSSFIQSLVFSSNQKNEKQYLNHAK